MTVFADNFLAGALITLLIPASAFIAVTIWYTRTVLRLARTRSDDTAHPTTPGPTPSTLTATEDPSGATP